VLIVAILGGCDGFGDSILMSNPSVARVASISEEEAEKYPNAKRYAWAFARYEIEANDIQRGIRWRNALKVRKSSRRAARFLKIMESLLQMEKDRQAAARSAEHHRALGEALSGGRWFRSGMDAACGLQREVADRLSPGQAPLKPDEIPAHGPGAAPTHEVPSGPRTVAAKRIMEEESAGGRRKRFVIVLEWEGGKEERDVSEQEFSAVRIGGTWPIEGSSAGERGKEKEPVKREGVQDR
jgi:hypothetical protein